MTGDQKQKPPSPLEAIAIALDSISRSVASLEKRVRRLETKRVQDKKGKH